MSQFFFFRLPSRRIFTHGNHNNIYRCILYFKHFVVCMGGAIWVRCLLFDWNSRLFFEHCGRLCHYLRGKNTVSLNVSRSSTSSNEIYRNNMTLLLLCSRFDFVCCF